MDIIGYKCFHEDLTNRYGVPFQVGKIYFASGIIKFGNHGNGFHMCRNMEDTLRYFDAMNEKVSICEVRGSGEIMPYYDEYYGYYDMFAVSTLKILKQLTHKEIIQKGLSLDRNKVIRFLSLFRLRESEIEQFQKQYQNEPNVLKTIAYYQKGDKDAYQKRRGSNHG